MSKIPSRARLLATSAALRAATSHMNAVLTRTEEVFTQQGFTVEASVTITHPPGSGQLAWAHHEGKWRLMAIGGYVGLHGPYTVRVPILSAGRQTRLAALTAISDLHAALVKAGSRPQNLR